MIALYVHCAFFDGMLSSCVVAVNKQLNDKERVAAALENPNLVDMVDECLAPTYGFSK